MVKLDKFGPERLSNLTPEQLGTFSVDERSAIAGSEEAACVANSFPPASCRREDSW